MKRKRCVEDLVSASVCDIARQSEVSQYIADGIFQSSEDKEEVDNNATTFLGHICNDTCKVRNADGTFPCRKIDNLKVSEDNTRYIFKPLPNYY